jgi:hypothetical protein
VIPRRVVDEVAWGDRVEFSRLLTLDSRLLLLLWTWILLKLLT